MSANLNMKTYLIRMMGLVEKFGVAIQGVLAEGDSPPFAYTVGMYRRCQAEVIVIGLPGEIAQDLLNNLFEKVKDGLVLEQGLLVEGIAAGFPVMLIEVLDRQQFTTGIANQLMRDDPSKDVPLFQMVWPLADGTWPRELEQQPILGILPPEGATP